MRELTDEQIEAMTPEEKAEYAPLRAASKYHQPHLDRESDGGSRRTLFQGLAVAGAVVLVCAAGWIWRNQTAAELDEARERIAEQNSFKNTTSRTSPVGRGDELGLPRAGVNATAALHLRSRQTG